MKAQTLIPLFTEELRTIVDLLDAEIAAYKNYVVSNVEERDFTNAAELAKKVRKFQDLRFAFSGPLRAIDRAAIEADAAAAAARAIHGYDGAREIGLCVDTDALLKDAAKHMIWAKSQKGKVSDQLYTVWLEEAVEGICNALGETE